MEKGNKESKLIIISPQAKQDIADVLYYLSENWNEKVVNDFLKRLETFYYIISINPRIFGYYNKRNNIRKFVLTKQNIIYYRNKKKIIEIICVFDGRQNPVKLKRKVK